LLACKCGAYFRWTVTSNIRLGQGCLVSTYSRWKSSAVIDASEARIGALMARIKPNGVSMVSMMTWVFSNTELGTTGTGSALLLISSPLGLWGGELPPHK
jgi:hypothetical protein